MVTKVGFNNKYMVTGVESNHEYYMVTEVEFNCKKIHGDRSGILSIDATWVTGVRSN